MNVHNQNCVSRELERLFFVCFMDWDSSVEQAITREVSSDLRNQMSLLLNRSFERMHREYLFQ